MGVQSGRIVRDIFGNIYQIYPSDDYDMEEEDNNEINKINERKNERMERQKVKQEKVQQRKPKNDMNRRKMENQSLDSSIDSSKDLTAKSTLSSFNGILVEDASDDESDESLSKSRRLIPSEGESWMEPILQ